jgi:hypothetical protein
MVVYQQIFIYVAIGAAAAPMWSAAVWVIWHGIVRPKLIPRDEVERLAAQLIESHGEGAADVAFANEYGAWRNSNGFEQGKWRRVRKLIESRCLDLAVRTDRTTTDAQIGRRAE